MKYAQITFGLVDTTARTDGSFNTTDIQNFCNLEQIRDESEYTTNLITCELNQTLLNGSFEILGNNQNYGYISSSISDGNGDFINNPILTRTFSNYHTTVGLGIILAGDSLPKQIIIKYYQDNTLIKQLTETPTEFSHYSMELVENYNKFTIEFVGTKIPYRYVRLAEVYYGIYKVWDKDYVVNANVIEETNLISDELSINEANFEIYDQKNDFNILNPQGIYSALQERQPIIIKEMIDRIPVNVGRFYLTEWEATVNSVAKFRAVDITGLLDLYTFKQNAIWQSTNFETALLEIIGNDVEYSLTDMSSVTVSGYIPLCSKRKALQKLCFASNCFVYIDRAGVINIQPIQNGSADYDINKSQKSDTKIMQNEKVNQILVSAYTITANSNSEELYKSALSEGQYEITWNDPATNINVTNASLLSSGIQYAIINVTGTKTVTITGKKYITAETIYDKRATVYNELFPVEVKDIYLINNSNVQSVAENIFNYYQKRFSEEFTLLTNEEKIGDRIDLEIENTSKVGTITKMDIDLVKGFISKVTVVSD